MIGSRRLVPPDALQPKAYCTNPVFSRSYLHPQVSPPETLVVKGGTIWARNGQSILPENARLPRNIQGSFTCRKSTTLDKWLYFLSEGRRAEDFFAPKNPTASARFEPANLTSCKTVSFSRRTVIHAVSKYIVQESSRILCNPKSHYRFYRYQRLFPILRQMNATHVFPADLSTRKIHLNTMVPSTPRSSKWSLSFRSSTKTPYASPLSVPCAPPNSFFFI